MKYEYRTTQRDWPMSNDELNDWGDRGWELASILTQITYPSGMNKYTYHFKRVKCTE